MMPDIILVDDEKHLRTACTQALELAGFNVTSYSSASGALDHINRSWCGVMVSDIRMAGMDGMELMNKALEIDPELPIILISGHGDIPMAVKAIRSGAYDFIEKPFPSDVLVEAVQRGMEKRRLVIENRELRAALDQGQDLGSVLIGRSDAMVNLRQNILNFADTDADILIMGETGSGKELVARSIHENSTRRTGRFVPINCGALPDTVIESELFGHEAGAFTGAQKTRQGKFEYAEGGTLFLDEIESMPMELQIKILRVLQDRKIVRLGANEEIDVDIRVVAATKEDLKQASNEGRFREDLYYRLNVLALSIPPLRKRKDDIPLLFHHFIDRESRRHTRTSPELDARTMRLLKSHNWPGNVRELQNVVLRYSLGLGLDLMGKDAAVLTVPDMGDTLADKMAEVEKSLIQDSLEEHGHKLKETYEALGVSRKTLYDKIRKYGLESKTPLSE